MSHAADILPPPQGWRLWWAGMRPRTLPLALAPVLVGLMLAAARTGSGEAWVLALIVVAALAIQAGTNLWNDAADADADRQGRLGPPRLVANGWAQAHAVRRAALLCFGLAALAGSALVWRGGWPILALGLASLLAGWAYSGGPWPIARTALGEVFVIAFFGLGAVGGTFWLLTLRFDPDALLVGLVMGLPAAAVLLVNNLRDRDGDAVAGRRTLAIRLGERWSRRLYAALVLLPFPALIPVGVDWTAFVPLAWALLLVRRGFRDDGAALNALLADTARYSLVLALGLAVGLK